MKGEEREGKRLLRLLKINSTQFILKNSHKTVRHCLPASLPLHSSDSDSCHNRYIQDIQDNIPWNKIRLQVHYKRVSWHLVNMLTVWHVLIVLITIMLILSFNCQIGCSGVGISLADHRNYSGGGEWIISERWFHGWNSKKMPPLIARLNSIQIQNGQVLKGGKQRWKAGL